MPVPAHMRVTFNFSLKGDPGVENAQFSLNMAKSDGGLSYPADDAGKLELANDFFNDCKTFIQSAGCPIGGSNWLTFVKVALIGADGLYMEDAWTSDEVAATAQQTVSTHALQTALAVTLDSDRRGPTGKGRIYLPLPALTLGPDGRAAVEDVQAAANATATFLNAINNHPGVDSGDMRVVVASSKGYVSPVTSVRVGRVLDTVRSRRKSQVEDHQVASVGVVG